MSVIKVRIQKNFTVLYNEVLENTNLSFKAKGLWAYCMSRPENWEFHVSHLATISKEKERSIYAALNELIKAGLVSRTQINKAKGERKGREGFGSVEYTIYPFPQEIQEIFAQRCFAHTQVARPQNDALVSNDKDKEMKKEQSAAPPARSSPSSRRKSIKEEKHEVAPGVWLTNTQRLCLLHKLGQNMEKAVACYDKLSDWKISKGKAGGNDYMSIVNWVIGAVEEDANKPKASEKGAEAKKLAEKIVEKWPNNRDIVLGDSYIEFDFGRERPHIKFTDGGFEEQVMNCLRKMNLKL